MNRGARPTGDGGRPGMVQREIRERRSSGAARGSALAIQVRVQHEDDLLQALDLIDPRADLLDHLSL